jgi:hypothetical protein
VAQRSYYNERLVIVRVSPVQAVNMESDP